MERWRGQGPETALIREFGARRRFKSPLTLSSSLHTNSAVSFFPSVLRLIAIQGGDGYKIPHLAIHRGWQAHLVAYEPIKALSPNK